MGQAAGLWPTRGARRVDERKVAQATLGDEAACGARDGKRRATARVEGGERELSDFSQRGRERSLTQHRVGAGAGQGLAQGLAGELGMNQRQGDTALCSAEQRSHVADRVLTDERDHVTRASTERPQALRGAVTCGGELGVAELLTVDFERERVRAPLGPAPSQISQRGLADGLAQKWRETAAKKRRQIPKNVAYQALTALAQGAERYFL